jgi:hypothetical protein
MTIHYFFFLVISMVNPLFSILALFLTKRRNVLKWGLIAVITVWGGVMPIKGGMDGMTLYNWMIYDYHGMSFSTFIESIFYILTFQNVPGIKGDLYIHFLSYILHPLLGVPNLFFYVVGFIYGYFFINALFKILDVTPKEKWSFANYVFFIVFILFCSLENMQSVRTWTGLWFLVNAVLGFYITNKKRYLYLIAFTPFFHNMYFLFVIPIFFVFVGPMIKKKIIFILFIVSFFVSVPKVNFLISTAQGTELGASKVRAYAGDDVAEEREELRSNMNTHKLLGKRDATRYFSYYFIVILFVFSYFKCKEIELSPLFTMSVIMISIANIFDSSIPAFSSRLSYVASGILFSFLFLTSFPTALLKNYLSSCILSKAIVFLGLIIFLPRIQYAVLMLLYGTNQFFILSPLISVVSNEEFFSLRDALDMFF